MYAKYIKRPLDFCLSLFALIALSPVLLILTIVGAAVMKGNPFFVQERSGKDEKIFKLIKFRTMTCEKDENGHLLPDKKRLTKYGKTLRSTSLDELPELINIFKGEMSIVGPRPLIVDYLNHYNAKDVRRHEVSPGLTGLAQVSGRNALTWKDKFQKDIEYVDNVTFMGDMKIILLTVKNIFKREGIEFVEGHQSVMDYFKESIKDD